MHCLPCTFPLPFLYIPPLPFSPPSPIHCMPHKVDTSVHKEQQSPLLPREQLIFAGAANDSSYRNTTSDVPNTYICGIYHRYIYMWWHIFIYIYTYVYPNTGIYIYMVAYIHVYHHVYFIYIYIYICLPKYRYIYGGIHSCILYTYVYFIYMHIFINIYISIQIDF